MKIAVVTCHNKRQASLAAITIPNQLAYAKAHGYAFLYQDADRIQQQRGPGWSKDVMVKEALRDYDLVFWIDTDAVILRPEIPITHFIDEHADLVFGCIDHFNNGVFIARRCKDMFRFLEDTWEVPIRNAELGGTADKNSEIWSQNCMTSLLLKNWQRIRIKNAGSDFSAHYYQQGIPFVLHVYGTAYQRRAEYITEALDGSRSFGAGGADLKVVQQFPRGFKGRFVEVCDGDGMGGIARKLARTGWYGDLIGQDDDHSDQLLQSYWRFNSIATHGRPISTLLPHVASVQGDWITDEALKRVIAEAQYVVTKESLAERVKALCDPEQILLTHVDY